MIPLLRFWCQVDKATINQPWEEIISHKNLSSGSHPDVLGQVRFLPKISFTASVAARSLQDHFLKEKGNPSGSSKSSSPPIPSAIPWCVFGSIFWMRLARQSFIQCRKSPLIFTSLGITFVARNASSTLPKESKRKESLRFFFMVFLQLLLTAWSATIMWWRLSKSWSIKGLWHRKIPPLPLTVDVLWSSAEAIEICSLRNPTLYLRDKWHHVLSPPPPPAHNSLESGIFSKHHLLIIKELRQAPFFFQVEKINWIVTFKLVL